MLIYKERQKCDMKYRINFLQRVEVFSCEVEADNYIEAQKKAKKLIDTHIRYDEVDFMDIDDDDVRNTTRDLTESESDIYDKMLNSGAVETGVKLF